MLCPFLWCSFADSKRHATAHSRCTNVSAFVVLSEFFELNNRPLICFFPVCIKLGLVSRAATGGFASVRGRNESLMMVKSMSNCFGICLFQFSFEFPLNPNPINRCVKLLVYIGALQLSAVPTVNIYVVSTLVFLLWKVRMSTIF